MTLEQLKSEQQTLVLQRAHAKDQVEQAEKGLGAIGFAIQVLEAQAKAEEPEAVHED